MNSTLPEIMILDGPLNENGMQWPVISLIFFGILSFGNMYIRWSAEDDKKKAAAKKSRKKVAKKKNLMPGPLSLYAQIGCTVWMLSSAIIFSVVPCETMSGFMWKWVTFGYPLSSTVTYLFLYAKQNTVKGTNPPPLTIKLSKLFLVLVSAVPFIGLGYFVFLVEGVRIEGVCKPSWEWWAPVLLTLGDTTISMICLFLFVSPLHEASKMSKTKDGKLQKVLKRNLYSCLLTMGTSLVTLIGCIFCGPDADQHTVSMFVITWVAFDKWTDSLAINIAFDDFKNWGGVKETIKPATGSSSPSSDASKSTITSQESQ